MAYDLPFIVEHPEAEIPIFAQNVADAKRIAAKMVKEHGPAVVEVFSITHVMSIDLVLTAAEERAVSKLMEEEYEPEPA